MSFRKDLCTDFNSMTPAQLERGIQRWLNGGSNDTERDAAIQKKVDKTLAKAAEKQARKKAGKSDAA